MARPKPCDEGLCPAECPEKTAAESLCVGVTLSTAENPYAGRKFASDELTPRTCDVSRTAAFVPVISRTPVRDVAARRIPHYDANVHGPFFWFLLLAAIPQGASQRPDSVEHVRDPLFSRALGVECSHCHVPDNWTDESRPTLAIARNMMRMVQVLNQKLDGVGKVSCATCHGGEARPSRLPRPSLDAELEEWPAELADAPEAQKLAMAVYNVSLGVQCNHCHVASWKDAEKQAMKTVALMSSLFAEFPKYMPPTARTQCYMCHKGSTKPLR
jgi:Photosynthetic reaction centre cytochrome C subunit